MFTILTIILLYDITLTNLWTQSKIRTNSYTNYFSPNIRLTSKNQTTR